MSFRSPATVIALLALVSTGCASRAVPFNDLDKAQVTVLRLQQQQPQAAAVPGQPAVLIPGIPPELQQMGQQVLQQIQPHIPPGLLPQGILPPAGAPAQPAAPPPRLYQNQWAIAGELPVMDDATKNELLDLFGSADNFSPQHGGCYNAGMAVSFRTPERIEAVDVAMSFSCNQAWGYGFEWPHPQAGFTPDTRQKLTDIYTRLWGAPPPADG